MIRLVKTKYSDKTFYVKMTVVSEFGIPIGFWVGVEDNKIYQDYELLFLNDI